MTSAPRPQAPPFAVTLPSGAAGPLVFASPHSGAFHPEDLRPAEGLSAASLRSAEDALVDRLIATGPACGAAAIVAGITRAYVDLNRDPAELDPLLIPDCPPGTATARTAAGFGVIPRRTGDGAPCMIAP